MTDGLRTSASGMIAQQKRVDVIANNLANVNTTGFKRSRTNFEDLLYETVQGPRRTVGDGVIGAMQIGHGVRLSAIQRVHGQGAAEMTGRPLDLAIEGEGFFQVELPDGSLGYTRDGSFTLSDSGQLVTNSGHALLPNIVLPPDATAEAGDAEAVAQVFGGFAGIQRGEVEAGGDALGQLAQVGAREQVAQFGLAEQHDLQRHRRHEQGA